MKLLARLRHDDPEWNWHLYEFIARDGELYEDTPISHAIWYEFFGDVNHLLSMGASYDIEDIIGNWENVNDIENLIIRHPHIVDRIPDCCVSNLGNPSFDIVKLLSKYGCTYGVYDILDIMGIRCADGSGVEESLKCGLHMCDFVSDPENIHNLISYIEWWYENSNDTMIRQYLRDMKLKLVES